ncbi:MAG: alpha/beta hydrolase [Pseudomonadota bacterium]
MTTFWISTGVVLAAIASALWLVTRWGTARIEARFPAPGKFVSTSTAPLHLVERGSLSDKCPSLLFVHGASSNHREFQIALEDKLQQRFGDDQHRVFVDRPGQGNSPRKWGDHSPRVQADRIAEAVRRLGVDHVIVIGHSWGGAVVAQLAVHHRELVRGAVFVAPATHPWEGGGWGGVTWYYGTACLPVIGHLFTELITLPVGWNQINDGVENVFAPEVPVQGYASELGARLVLRPSSFRANAQDVFQLRPFVRAESHSYASIQCPVHVITGDQDGVVWPHIHSDGLERDIKGATKTVIAGGGHMPHHTHGDLILDCISEVYRSASANA